ncbi:MAG: mercury methylation ferredoxin HgcB [Chitinispirillaceae bacterium]|jgi:ferredoxin
MKYLKNVATIALDKNKCVGCKRCVEVCPRGVLVIRERKATIVGRDLCIECGACERNCEFGALSVASGVGCAQALFNAMITGGEPVCDCEKGKSETSGCC